MISGSSGAADGFRVALPRAPAVLDMPRAPHYASSRCLDGIIEAQSCSQAGAAEKQILMKSHEAPGE